MITIRVIIRSISNHTHIQVCKQAIKYYNYTLSLASFKSSGSDEGWRQVVYLEMMPGSKRDK